jgi:hypothetical protein
MFDFPIAVEISSTRGAVVLATRRNEVVGGKSGPKRADLWNLATPKGPKLSATGRRALVTMAFGVAVIQYAH